MIINFLEKVKQKHRGSSFFCPPVVPQSGTGGGNHFRNSVLAKCQNRTFFVSLIEKYFM
jgi:hypothetical protein